MVKILLVEDDKSLREIYGVRLLAEGYDIVSAGDGEEALAVAIKERPDLILSDVMMPKVSGFDMLDILRSTTETRNIKVIIMTALSNEEQRQRGESLGADLYLVKSQVGIEDVVRAVKEILYRSSRPIAQSILQTATTPSPSYQSTSEDRLNPRQQFQFGTRPENQFISGSYVQPAPSVQPMPRPTPTKSINKLGSSLERVIHPNPESSRDNFDAQSAITDALRDTVTPPQTVQASPEPTNTEPQPMISQSGDYLNQQVPQMKPTMPTEPPKPPFTSTSTFQTTTSSQSPQSLSNDRPSLVQPLQQIQQLQQSQPSQTATYSQSPSQPLYPNDMTPPQSTPMSNYRPAESNSSLMSTQFPPDTQPPVI